MDPSKNERNHFTSDPRDQKQQLIGGSHQQQPQQRGKGGEEREGGTFPLALRFSHGLRLRISGERCGFVGRVEAGGDRNRRQGEGWGGDGG